MALGTHPYKLLKDLYYPESGNMEVKADAKTVLDLTLKPNHGFVNITTNPAGADIMVDGIPLQKNSPVTTDKLKSGNHTVVARKTLYHDATTAVIVNDGKTTPVTIDLNPAFGSIKIASQPEAGAEVSLDGQTTGKKTPCTFEQVMAGEHTITLRREWYENYTGQVTLAEGEQKELNQVLKATYGNVKVTSNPPADIYIDGLKKSAGTWDGRLTVGIHSFEARKDKYSPSDQKYEVKSGKDLQVSLEPLPRYGTVKIVTNPMDASIALDGKDMGTSPATLRNILIGDYKLTLTKKDYVTVAKTISITEGQTTEISETLPNGAQVSISSSPTGAQLIIDGVSSGSTPFNGTLSYGSHNLKLTKGERVISQSITINQSSNNSFNYVIYEGHKIGESYGGGIIFYVSDDGQHGLIAAKADQGSGNWSEAYKLCKNYKGGGYNDWRLPTKEELNKLYKQKDVVDGFSINLYWSITYYLISVSCLNFNDGVQGLSGKTDRHFVRAVRSF